VHDDDDDDDEYNAEEDLGRQEHNNAVAPQLQHRPRPPAYNPEYLKELVRFLGGGGGGGGGAGMEVCDACGRRCGR
jgi:hypothetical protein